MEYLGPKFFPAYETLIPIFIQLVGSPDRDLRQGAAYGLSVAAMHAGPRFGPWIGPAARALHHSIQQPASREDPENWSATDNMIAALGNIVSPGLVLCGEGWKIRSQFRSYRASALVAAGGLCTERPSSANVVVQSPVPRAG